MRVLVVDQCSNKKALPDSGERLDESRIDDEGLEGLLQKEGMVTRPARDLYSGRQQQLVSQAVDQLRAAEVRVDRYFVSAGFGIVPENQSLPAYDVSFQGKEHAETRGRKLGLPEAVTQLITDQEKYDVVFLLLGATYYEAIDVEKAVREAPEDTFVVVFNREGLAEDDSTTLSLKANAETGSRYGGGAIGVKGTYLKNFASNVVAGRNVETISDVEKYCTSPYTEQAGFDQFGDL